MSRLPPLVLRYVRLVGPAVLASLAAVSLTVRSAGTSRPEFHVGPEWIAVALCVAAVAWRRNLLLGLLLAAGLMAILRAIGWAVV
jgi:branched-subunit amino acid transport protein